MSTGLPLTTHRIERQGKSARSAVFHIVSVVLAETTLSFSASFEMRSGTLLKEDATVRLNQLRSLEGDEVLAGCRTLDESIETANTRTTAVHASISSQTVAPAWNPGSALSYLPGGIRNAKGEQVGECRRDFLKTLLVGMQRKKQSYETARAR